MDGLAVVVRAFASDAVPHPRATSTRRATSSCWKPSCCSPTSPSPTTASSGSPASSASARPPTSRRSGRRSRSCRPALAAGTPLRDVALSADEAPPAQGVHLPHAQAAARRSQRRRGRRRRPRRRRPAAPAWRRPAGPAANVVVCPLCATLEEEISRLAPAGPGRVPARPRPARPGARPAAARRLRAARADLVPHRRRGRVPRLVDLRPARRRCAGRRGDPLRPRAGASSAPRWCRGRSCSTPARFAVCRHAAPCAWRARSTSSRTVTSSPFRFNV